MQHVGGRLAGAPRSLIVDGFLHIILAYTRGVAVDKAYAAAMKRYLLRFGQVASALEDNGRFTCQWEDRYPCLNDARGETPFDAHYIYHTAWAARILAQSRPTAHVDIASSLYFVSLVSAFVPITFYDYRPAKLSLSNLECKKADIMGLPFEDKSILSLSCMHVVEHIGLERYGDTFAPQGDLKAMSELSRVLHPGGQLLFVVPIGGIARIQYNAHRIYRYRDVLLNFGGLNVESFSLVTDHSVFIQDATEADADQQRYGCGCFLFKKTT